MNSVPFPLFSSSKLHELDYKINTMGEASHTQMHLRDKVPRQKKAEDGLGSNPTDDMAVSKER